jgi:hypothetical protein
MSARLLSPAVLATTSLLLAACGPALRSARDEAIVVPQGATWAWGPRDAAYRGDHPREAPPRAARPPSDAAAPGDEIVLQRFARAAAAAMQAKGFRQVDSAADAEFLLAVGYRAAEARSLRGGPSIGIGIGGVWGGRGRRGWYEPWGGGPWGFGPRGGGWMFVPWGWSWYGPMGWAQVPMGGAYGPMAYRESALVAQLRQRATGYLAWRGQVATDDLAVSHLTQDRMNALVAKLFRTLP